MPADCEPLEPRLALSASLSSQGVLVIVGNAIRNTVLVQPAGVGFVNLFGVPGVTDGTTFSGILRITADLKSGDDTFTVSTLTGATGLPVPITVLGGNGRDFFNFNSTTSPINANGGNGNDNIYSADGDDKLSGGKGDDLISGGPGNDRLDGQNGNDIIVGGEGDDTVIGGIGIDRLYGNQGNDTLRGGSGADLLVGGQGTDSVQGHAGADRFYCTSAEAVDYGTSDPNFIPFAGPNYPTASLFGTNAWERLGEAENTASRQLYPEIIAATNALADAIADNFSTRSAFLAEADDDPFILSQLKGLFPAVLSGHMAEFVANPQGVTAQDLDELGHDLFFAAGSLANFGVGATRYDTFRRAFFGSLSIGPFLNAIHQLAPNAVTTARYFDAFAATLDLEDDY